MLHENENDADGILQILKSLYAYVPSYGTGNEKKYVMNRVWLVTNSVLNVELMGICPWQMGSVQMIDFMGCILRLLTGMLETSFLRYSFSTCNCTQSLLSMTKLFLLKLLG